MHFKKFYFTRTDKESAKIVRSNPFFVNPSFVQMVTEGFIDEDLGSTTIITVWGNGDREVFGSLKETMDTLGWRKDG